ncbi:two-component system response regulator [Halobacteriovorax marinus]|uniref:Two-component system response regulator n=1 Tax=Halobacteriovorax marinus TaxID=97084 RepID=A0A1Y5FE98_9BACT|nr:two-component system response regulator [Halobacteriovorax marinus]
MQPRILLIEDNETNRKLAIRFLQDDYFVLVAENGQQGVEIALSEIPDLILMDLSMPIMNGWDATRILKREKRTLHIPIIALSAHVLSEHMNKALEAGCDDYQTKPFDFDELITKINFWLSKRAA